MPKWKPKPRPSLEDKMPSTRTKTSFSLKAGKLTSRSQSTSLGLSSTLALRLPKSRQGCCLEAKLCSTHRSSSERSGNEPILQIISPLSDRELASSIVFLPSPHLARLQDTKGAQDASPTTLTSGQRCVPRRWCHLVVSGHQVAVPYGRTEHCLCSLTPHSLTTDFGAPCCARLTCTSPLPCRFSSQVQMSCYKLNHICHKFFRRLYYMYKHIS